MRPEIPGLVSMSAAETIRQQQTQLPRKGFHPGIAKHPLGDLVERNDPLVRISHQERIAHRIARRIKLGRGRKPHTRRYRPMP
jgi:hypothetical protein